MMKIWAFQISIYLRYLSFPVLVRFIKIFHMESEVPLQATLPKPLIDQVELQKIVDNLLDTKVQESLLKYIEIPNVTHSFYNDKTEWEKDLPPGETDRTKDGGYNLIAWAGNHIKDWVAQLGIKGATVTLHENYVHTIEGGLKLDKTITPIILTVIESSGIGDNKEDTYFFYGHFDKQPPMDDINKWDFGEPYKPLRVDGPGEEVRIYGRGGADDGYSTYATMVAIKALQDLNVPLPRIVMITEGDEETGNGDVELWINRFIKEFGTPKLVFCLDSGTLDYDRFWLTNSLRGYLVTVFKVKVLNEAVHSGSGSGIIPTCFRIIRQLLERIENTKTGEIPSLDIEVPENRKAEVKALVDALGKDSVTHYNTVQGLQTPLPTQEETILLNTWRAQLEVLGITGYPPTDKTSNIIAPEVDVKISIRLPPTLDHFLAEEIIRKEFYQNVGAPYHCQFRELEMGSDNGFDAPLNPAALTAVFEESSQAVFGKQHLSMGQGGSIPFMNFLKEKWPEARFVITGLLGPQSNAHGPNECLRWDYLKKLTACFSQIIARSIPLFFQPTEPKEPKESKDCHKDHDHEHGHKKHHHHGHGHSHSHGHSGHHGKNKARHHL